jgi:ABC-type multidrug transport system fused ATPase/permease subunit
MFFGLRGVLFLVGGSCCLVYQAPLLSVIAIAAMLAINIFSKPLNKKLRTMKEEENRELKRLSEFSNDRLGNLKLIKLNNAYR